MLSFSLGPLALPVAPVLLLACVALASWLAGRIAQARGLPGANAGDAVIHAALLGLLAARITHLALNADAYLADSLWSALDLRDGGWNLFAGVIAGSAWLGWHSWRVRALTRPLGWAGGGAALLWMAATLYLQPDDAQRLPAMPFTELASGQTQTLEQAAGGQPLVVNLWASWCGPCRQEMPMLAQAQQRHSQVAFAFVNQGESAAAVRRYLDAEGLALRGVLLDSGSRLEPLVGSSGLPTTLFYDASGRLIDAHFGVLNAAALETRLRELSGPR